MRLLFFILAVLISGIKNIQAQKGIEFRELNFEKALETAKKENKMLFLDAYTSWCGPCKKMAAEVFSQPAVGEFMNSRFVSIKVNMEKKEGRKLAERFGIKVYPTMLLIREDGVMHDKLIGGYPARQFIERIRKSVDRKHSLEEWEKRYHAGEREAEFLAEYIELMLDMRSAKTANEIAGELLKNLGEEEAATPLYWWMFERDDLTSRHSRTFKYLTAHIEKFREKLGEEKVDRRLFEIYRAPLIDIISGEDEGFFRTLKNMRREISALNPDSKDIISAYIELAEARMQENPAKMLITCRKAFPLFSNKEAYAAIPHIADFIAEYGNKKQISEFDDMIRDFSAGLKDKKRGDELLLYWEELKKKEVKNPTRKTTSSQTNPGRERAMSVLNKTAPVLEVEKWVKAEPDLKGKFVLIDFWATWCGPCMKMIPQLNSLAEKFKEDLVVIGLTDESLEKIQKMKEPQINYHIAIDTRKRLKKSLKLRGIPHVIILDPQGIVRWESLPPLTDKGLNEEVVRDLIAVYK